MLQNTPKSALATGTTFMLNHLQKSPPESEYECERTIVCQMKISFTPKSRYLQKPTTPLQPTNQPTVPITFFDRIAFAQPKPNALRDSRLG